MEVWLEDSGHLRTPQGSRGDDRGQRAVSRGSERSRRLGVLGLQGWPLSALPVGRISGTCWTHSGGDEEAAEEMVESK